METTCPHCTQALELDDETVAVLDGTTHFECPVCGGMVPAAEPLVALGSPTIKGAKITCQICLETMEVASHLLSTLQANSQLNCPTCGSLVPLPASREIARPQSPAMLDAVKTDGTMPLLVNRLRGMNRNLVILGSVALLLLGGFGVFLALKKGPSTRNNKRLVKEELINNKFFQELVASGATTAADLQQVANVRPMGVTFIGVSKDKLTFERAQALAKRTGSHLLTIEPPNTAMRKPVLDAVAAAYPELGGTTSWCMEGGEPCVLDGPDVNRVTTLDRPRVALFNWYPVRNDKDRAWLRLTKITPPVKKVYKVREWVNFEIEYNNPELGEVLITSMARVGGKDAENWGGGGHLYDQQIGRAHV